MATNQQVPTYPISIALFLGPGSGGKHFLPAAMVPVWKATAYNNPMGLENRPVDDGTTSNVAFKEGTGGMGLDDVNGIPWPCCNYHCYLAAAGHFTTCTWPTNMLSTMYKKDHIARMSVSTGYRPLYWRSRSLGFTHSLYTQGVSREKPFR